jgi:LmbE family N-acetylglucosaminyl deacetylase
VAAGKRKPHTLSKDFTRILCISAHPDDNEFTIAGSVCALGARGRHVVFCLVTTGGSGTNEHTPDNTGLIPIRERESWDAAKILGVKDVVFLGYQDGEVEPTIALRRDLTRVIRR